MIPVVSVSGDARTRGRQYGEQAKERIASSISAYRDVFADYATWDWPTVLAEARRFRAPIAAFGAAYYDELVGIAEGAGVPLDEIVAINVRTEIMFAAKARTAGARLPTVAECTAFAHVERAGAAVVGQNWDWLPHAFDTVVRLEAVQESGPRYVTVVEAGLLAKLGMNSAGLGVCTNALVSSLDVGEPAVPYHVLLRALLDAETASDALAVLQRGRRSSSANYLIAHSSGLALDVEGRPGDFAELYLLQPDQQGHLVHTNHFCSPRMTGPDVGLWLMPDSPFRLQRATAALREVDGSLGAPAYESVLTDHAGAPFGVCTHPDPALAPTEQSATVASAVMDLPSRTLLLSSGLPCRTGYDTLPYADFFAAEAHRRTA
jgi:isopenicillin-N N-acyltransferase-like protein